MKGDQTSLLMLADPGRKQLGRSHDLQAVGGAGGGGGGRITLYFITMSLCFALNHGTVAAPCLPAISCEAPPARTHTEGGHSLNSLRRRQVTALIPLASAELGERLAGVSLGTLYIVYTMTNLLVPNALGPADSGCLSDSMEYVQDYDGSGCWHLAVATK